VEIGIPGTSPSASWRPAARTSPGSVRRLLPPHTTPSQASWVGSSNRPGNSRQAHPAVPKRHSRSAYATGLTPSLSTLRSYSRPVRLQPGRRRRRQGSSKGTQLTRAVGRVDCDGTSRVQWRRVSRCPSPLAPVASRLDIDRPVVTTPAAFMTVNASAHPCGFGWGANEHHVNGRKQRRRASVADDLSGPLP
jgi:hypothetical protein